MCFPLVVARRLHLTSLPVDDGQGSPKQQPPHRRPQVLGVHGAWNWLQLGSGAMLGNLCALVHACRFLASLLSCVSRKLRRQLIPMAAMLVVVIRAAVIQAAVMLQAVMRLPAVMLVAVMLVAAMAATHLAVMLQAVMRLPAVMLVAAIQLAATQLAVIQLAVMLPAVMLVATTQLAATQLAVIQLAVMLPAVMLVAATQLAVTLLAVMLQAVMLLAAILLAAMLVAVIQLAVMRLAVMRLAVMLLAVIQLAVMRLGVMLLVVMCPGAMLMLPEAIQLAVVLQLMQTPAPSAPRQASIVALRTRMTSLPLPTTMRVAVTAMIATSTRRHWRSMQAWLLRSSQLALWLPASLWCNVGDATRTPT
mgnify:CR=1 FL=1